MRKKILKVLVWTVILVMNIFILSSLNSLVNEINIKDPVKRNISIPASNRFNQYGLPLGQELSQTPFYEDGNYVFYTDRILKRFNYNRDQIVIGKNILQKLSDLVPKNINTYVIPLPKRIIWEGNYPDDIRNYKNFLKEFYDVIPNTMSYLNVLPILEEHSKENLFYRSDDGWTARGAYYGSKLLLENMGLPVIPIEDYEEHMYLQFEGMDEGKLISEYEIPEGVLEKVRGIRDPNYYYLIPGGKNRGTRTSIWKGTTITENIKMVSKSRTGRRAFVGHNYLWAVAEGENKSIEKDGKTILLLSDLDGSMLVPFLTPYYENVYIVNITYGKFDKNQFENIFKNYNISDLVIVQKAEDIGDLSKSKFLNEILKLENKE